jgi:hypothetical protein
MVVLSAISPIDAYLLVRDRNQERIDAALRSKGQSLPQ